MNLWKVSNKKLNTHSFRSTELYNNNNNNNNNDNNNNYNYDNNNNQNYNKTLKQDWF